MITHTYVFLVGDTVLTATVTIFLIATVMNLAQSAVTSSSGLIFFLINLQQAFEPSKNFKINRGSRYSGTSLFRTPLGPQSVLIKEVSLFQKYVLLYRLLYFSI